MDIARELRATASIPRTSPAAAMPARRHRRALADRRLGHGAGEDARRRRGRCRDRSRARGIPAMARRAGAASRRARAPLRRGASREQGRARPRSSRIEAGKIVAGGARRSAGDDRHLRFRRAACRASSTASRSPSERPGHRMSETWHPLGVGRRDQRVQLPGRGVGVELRARARVRRLGRVEAVGEDAAHGARVSGALRRARAKRFGECARRGSREVVIGGARGRRGARRRSARCRSSARRARRAWAARWRRASRRASAARCSSSAATTR